MPRKLIQYHPFLFSLHNRNNANHSSLNITNTKHKYQYSHILKSGSFIPWCFTSVALLTDFRFMPTFLSILFLFVYSFPIHLLCSYSSLFLSSLWPSHRRSTYFSFPCMMVLILYHFNLVVLTLAWYNGDQLTLR